MNRTTALALAAAAMTTISAGTAQALSYTFQGADDGSGFAWDAGFDLPAGTSLSPGDDFSMIGRTAGDAYWRVDYAFTDMFAPFSFLVEEPAVRTVNAVAHFLLDGVEQMTLSEFGISEQLVYIGAQSWTLPIGLEFDEVVLDVDFLAIDREVDTTIGDVGLSLIQFSSNLFVDSFRIGLVIPEPGGDDGGGDVGGVGGSPGGGLGGAQVPLPAAAPLLGAGLAALGFLARRRRG